MKKKTSMELREEIKILLVKNRMTMTNLAKEMEARAGKKMSLSSLSDKLIRETLRFRELKLICEILGYEIKLEKK